MTEINKKLDLAAIPPTNNDGDPYILPLDIYKEGYQAYNISNWFKGRVGDNGTPFAIRWYSHGRLLNIQGMRPFIEGQVGDYTIDDSDPDNVRIDMAEDASNIHIVGDVDDTQAGGVAIYRLINQAFPKSGIFYGKIGFMGTQDDGTLVNTGVDIVFKVLAGNMNMLGARKFYVTELEKAILDFQAKTVEQKKDFEAKIQDVLQKLQDQYKQEVAEHQGALLNDTKGLEALSAEIESLIAKLKDSDVIGTKQYDNDMDNLKYLVENKLANMSYTPEAFPTAQDIQNTYPHGKAGIMLAVDTGHKWVYYANSWQDCGVYQGVELGDKAVDDVASKLSEKTGNYWSIQTPNFNSANDKADNQGYLLARKYPAGFIKNIQLKVDTPTDAKLFIFKYDRENLIDSGLMLTLTHEFNITSDTVTINQEIDHPFLIGIKCAGAYYSESDTTLYNVLGQIKVGESYNFPIPQTHGTQIGLEFAFKINYSYFKENTSTVENVPTLNYKEPNYSDDIYPLVFDFTINKAKIDAMFLANNGLIDYFTLVKPGVLSLDLPPLENTNTWQNYFLIANGNELEVVKHNSDQFIKGYSGNWKIIAGFCVVVYSDTSKKFCYIYSGINTDLVKIIFHTPQSDNPEEFYDIVTQKIINNGLYHYTYAALGDSLTHGEDPTNGYKPALGHRYTDWVSKTLGMFTYNYGIGGTRITRTSDGKGMVDRAKDIGANDVISVFGGTNDQQGNVPIGKIDDGDLTHFAPAFDKLIQELLNINGKKFYNPHIFIITPLKSQKTMTPNTQGLTIEDYANCEKEIAKKYSIPVLDLTNTYQFNDAQNSNYTERWMPDHMHPTAIGYDVIGIKVSHFIRNLIDEMK